MLLLKSYFQTLITDRRAAGIVYTEVAWIYISKSRYSRTMPNAWQDYAALIFAFYNRSGI